LVHAGDKFRREHGLGDFNLSLYLKGASNNRKYLNMTTCETISWETYAPPCDLEFKTTQGLVIKIGTLAVNYPKLLTELMKVRIESLVRYGDLKREEIPERIYFHFINE